MCKKASEHILAVKARELSAAVLTQDHSAEGTADIHSGLILPVLCYIHDIPILIMYIVKTILLFNLINIVNTNLQNLTSTVVCLM